MPKELTKVEQRYDAVLAVIRAGMSVTEATPRRECARIMART